MKKVITIIVLLNYAFSFSQVVTTISGFQGSGYYDSFTNISQFNHPVGICADAVGNLYIGDSFNNKIRKIGINGFVTTFAGSTDGCINATGTAAQFGSIRHLCMDTSNNLYVVDSSCQKIRKITPAGVVTTFAGSSQGYQDGVGSSAKFNNPDGICIDIDNNLYVADSDNQRIRKITPTGYVTTIAGGTYGIADGVGSAAQFKWPQVLCLDTQNNLIVGDFASGRLRKITPDGTVTTLAGTEYGHLDGAGNQARFGSITGICRDSQNNIYLSCELDKTIRKLDTQNNVTTIAGVTNSSSSSSDGVGTQAILSNPNGMCIFNDTIYFVEYAGGRIRKITNFLGNEQFAKNTFTVFPNPNKGNFTIQSENLIKEISIYDVLGRVTYNQNNINSNSYSINNASLTKGIYFVRSTTLDNNKSTVKMIVE